MNNPKLDKPGAGLPPIEAFMARYVVFPLQCKLTTRAQAIQKVLELGQSVLEQVKGLPIEQQHTQVLIPRITGLEDSSRFWSPLMVLEHLLITGTGMQNVCIRLSTGQGEIPAVRIEEVKPNPTINAEALFEHYHHFLNDYPATINNLPATCHQTHAHPWFGQINLHQWLCLQAFHLSIHHKQLQLILDNA